MRRVTVGTASRVILATSMIATPAALLMLWQGALMPFVVVTIGLASGFLTLALYRRGQYDHAAAGQVYATLLVGLVLAMADPGIVDFGLAVALLAPVQAGLIARTPVKPLTWVVLVAVIAVGGLPFTGLVTWPEPVRSEYPIIGALAFLVTAGLIAALASRINSAFASFELAQMTAYRHLVESVQDAVMRFGAEGAVVFASRSAEKLFGCRRYELSGSGLIERIHVLDRPAYMTAFSEVAHGVKPRTVEVRMRRDDPAEPTRIPQFIWIEVAFTPVVDESRPAAGHEIVALLRDVTTRHTSEAEMREARRAAEDASNAKSRFLATIGHELRTPLNAIVGFSEMMTSGVVGDLSPAHREYADIIHKSGHHLLDVVRMLLDMSRLEAGKFELQTDSFDPQGLIDPCLKMVESMAREREVKLVTEMPTILPMLVADERACRQVLINLLSNAIKFSNPRGVVTVSMKRQGAMLNISVADRGIGMDSNAVNRLGEPFFQAQDGLSRRYEGTGLGLSIVKGLVDLHQGTMRALSSPGDGTTITILLPLNGPATKKPETHQVTPLVRETAAAAKTPRWDDEKRQAS